MQITLKAVQHSRAITCILLLGTSLAHTQESTTIDTVKTYRLSGVLVTATRGSGEALLIPMAVGIVSLKDFQLSRRFNLEDALSLMPGVFAQSRAGDQDTRVTIRGFGARGSGDRSNAATIRGIKVLIDGIPETEPDGRTPLDLIDLYATERIEVVRSNASTLFGNASGGVINFQTRTTFNQPFVESNNTFGSFGLRRNNIALGSSLGSGRLFVSGTSTQFDGWRRNSGSASTQITAAVTSVLDEVTNLRVVAGGANSRFSIPGALTQSQFDADPTQANATYLSRRERRSNKVGRLGLELSRAFTDNQDADLFLFVNPKALARSERGTYRDFTRYHIGGGGVYRYTSGDDQLIHRITAGVDEAYQDGAILFYNLVNGERGDSLRTNKREGAETFGVFLQTELILSSRLSLTLGGRYDRQRYIAEDYAAGVKRKSPTEELTFEHVTPKVALLYRVSNTHSLYLNIGGGVEAPASNEVDPPPTLPNALLNPILKPMSSTTIEIGAKGLEQLSENRVLRWFSYSMAAYRIGITNEIIPYNGGAYFFSAGESRRTGVELAAQFDFHYGFSLTSAFTYLDAVYETYASDLGDFSGRSVPGIPKTLFTSRLRYRSEAGITLDVTLHHVGAYAADDANAYTIPSSTIIGSSASYEFKIGALSVRGFVGVSNAADSQYSASAFINPVGAAFLEPGLPRNYFGGLDVNLGL